jgi:hypothetical protein
MRDIYYHLLNSAIAGGLVMLGGLSTVLTSDPSERQIMIGLGLGVVTGLIVFLNKFNDWVSLQDVCTPKLLNFV